MLNGTQGAHLQSIPAMWTVEPANNGYLRSTHADGCFSSCLYKSNSWLEGYVSLSTHSKLSTGLVR